MDPILLWLPWFTPLTVQFRKPAELKGGQPRVHEFIRHRGGGRYKDCLGEDVLLYFNRGPGGGGPVRPTEVA